MPAPAPLRGIGILITRPVHQAETLARRVGELGGVPVLFPALAIEPLAESIARDMRAERLASFDLAIFVSPNAARIATEHMARFGGLPRSLKIAAVGPGTAAELANAGVGGDGGAEIIKPAQGSDSEALLEELPAPKVRGLRVAIIRGEGGRELLGRVLAERGARVEYFECYRRVRPAGALDTVLPRWRSGGIGASIATSAQIVDNLYAMSGDAGLHWVRETPMFVPHPRVAHAAYRRGTRRIVVAGAGNSALVGALETWFGRLGPAPVLQSNS